MPNASAKAESTRALESLIGAFEFRSDALFVLREYYREHGFIEVSTPVAIRAPAAEEYIESPRACGDLFLRSSPELEMKRLMAAGMKRIWELGPCFRSGEHGKIHRQEFDMLEWYMADAGYKDMLDFTAGLVRRMADRLNTVNCPVDVFKSWEIIPVREAFRHFAGENADECAEEEARFEMVLVDKVEPNLPKDRPCVLIDYPVRFGAFARRKPEDPTLVERWEVYMNGVELANAYGELVDAAEQRARFRQFNLKRKECGLTMYPEPTEFLEAIDSGIPESTGCAMGFDRLLMTLQGKHVLDEVCYPAEDVRR